MRRIHAMIRLLLLLALPLGLCPRLEAAAVQSDHVEVELIAENQQWQSGDNWVGLRIQPEAGWHVYWRNPGDSGLPTQLQWQDLPPGVEAGALQWPYPHEHRLGDLVNYGYGDNTLLPVRLQLTDQDPGTLRAKAQWLVCADVCIPGQAELSLQLPFQKTAQPNPQWSDLFARTRAALPRPSNWAAHFQIDQQELRVAIDPLPAELSGQTVAFYPYAASLINHAGHGNEHQDAGQLRLSRPLSDYFVEAPTTVEGLLVVGAGASAQAYEFSASPGAVAALPAAAAMTTAGVPAGELPASLWRVLLLAFAGGLILNLMPCVFPVLSLKALSVMKAQGQAAAEHRRHALAYSAGVVGSFLLAAGVLIALRNSGAALGWGFQLQSPLFVGLLIYVMVALGLSLSGLLQFGTSWMGAGQSLAARPGLSGSFFTGVLAVVVASPCTAPFMGAALGYALTQPPAVSLTVFLALGLGLAAPFLLLGFAPALAAWLPRPGAWMETLKQFLAYPLYLTAVWLLWVLGGLTDRNGMALALVGVVALAFGLWRLGSTRRGLSKWIGLIAILGAFSLLFHPLIRSTATSAPASHAGWEPYSDARFAELRAQQRTVFVDFTADWCLTCKVNERVALRTDTVARAFADHQVATLVADWTRADPAITATLARYGRSGVPLYLVSRRGAEPEILPQVLTPKLVAAAVTPP